MQNPKQQIVLKKSCAKCLTYFFIPTSILCIFFLVWAILEPSMVWVCIILCVFLSFLPISYFIIVSNGKKCVKSPFNRQYPENLNPLTTNHNAFIIVHSPGDNMVYAGIDNLINKFTATKNPFRIYDCNNPDEFKTVVANEKAKRLWIFGHGWRGGITFKGQRPLWNSLPFKAKNNTYFSYCDLIENDLNTYPSKDFVAQLHCNHFSKKHASNRPLPEFLMENNLGKDNYHVSDSKNNPISVYFTTKKLVTNIKRNPAIHDE